MRHLGDAARWLAAAGCAAMLAIASASGPAAQVRKELAPIPAETLALMAARGTGPAAPVLMRIFKKESELEIWKKARSGRYVLVKTFPICRWSGQLGPKLKEGDRQTPEGFYAVTPRQMNPNSSYYLSFDLGYPNAYDRAQGGTGSFLMVHGTCSSMGCYAMTDAAVGEIYAIAREAFAGGQGAFQVQAYPFRMSAQAMARHRLDPHIGFWRQLKEGYDRFEATGEELAVRVEDRRYAFAPTPSAPREAAIQMALDEQHTRIDELVEDGAAAIRTTYGDGGMHATFAALIRRGVAVGEVSRPETLALAGRETVLVRARRPQAPPQIAEAAAGFLAFVPIAPAADLFPAATTASDVAVLFASAPIGAEASALSLGASPPGLPRFVGATPRAPVAN